MHFHLSSVSCLALATVATLALPISAPAADFVYRNGKKVASSLELPVGTNNIVVNEGVAELAGVHNAVGVTAGFTKLGAGQLILSGESLITAPVTIQAGLLNVTGTLTAPVSILSGAMNVRGKVQDVAVSAGGTLIIDSTATTKGSARNVTSLGNVLINGGATGLTINGGSATINNGGSSYTANVNAGELVNNGNIHTANVASGAGFVNNRAGSVKSLTNSGIASNNGSIATVQQNGGSFANGANGTINGLSQNGGVSTNDGEIINAVVSAGTLTNNATGKINLARLSGGTLISGGAIGSADVETLGNLTNNLSGTIDSLKNAGTVANSGQIGFVTQTAGSLTNNGTILSEATIKGGTLTNNKAISTANISAGANFVNNKDGKVRAITNSGTASNDGSIRSFEQKAGTLVNQANGALAGLIQSGGITTNNGTIDRANVEGGTLVNNQNGKVGETVLTAGTFQNSGTITTLSVGADGAFSNNKTGLVQTVTSLGVSSNGGTILNLEVNGGTFNNSQLVKGNVDVRGGVFSSTGLIGGTLNNLAESNIAGSINGGVSNASNAILNLIGNLSGKGKIATAGTFNSVGQRTITGFDTFTNTGVMNIADDLSVGGDIISSGTIRLNGNNLGGDSLSVGGDLTLTSSSMTSLDIVSDGTHDTISATGDVTLDGRLNVTATGNTFGLKSTFDAFTSIAGNVVGQFTDVVISGANNLFGTIEDTTNGRVVAIRNRDILNNQLNVPELGQQGNVLTGFDYTGAKGAQLFDTLASLKAADKPGLLSQITGAATSAVVSVGSSAAQGFGNLMQKVATASGLRRSNDGVLAYEKARKAEEGTFEPILQQGQGAVGFWARGFGETGSSNGNGDATIGGVGAGVEVALGQSLTVGASAGYSMARFGHGLAVEGKTNSFHGGGYVALGATAPEATGFGLTASGSFSKHDTKANRTLKIGAMTTIANANYSGTTIAGEVMVRNGFTVGNDVPLTIAPIAGVKFSMDNDNGYTETGAGALNLNVSSAKRKSLAGVVGLQLASRIETTSVVFTPHVSATYQHEFLDTSSTTTRTLAGSPTPFTVRQGGGSRSSVALEAGLGMRFAGGLAVDISGYGVISADEKRYGATATLKAGF